MTKNIDDRETKNQGEVESPHFGDFHEEIQSLPYGIVSVDLKGVITFCNKAFARYTGYSPKELTGRPVYDFLTHDGTEKVRDELKERASGSKSTYITRMIDKDRNTLVVRVSATPRLNDKGEIIGSLAFASNITDDYNREKALSDSEKRLELALEGAEIGLWDWNLLADTMQYDERWATMLGYDLDEIKDVPEFWKKTVHPDDLVVANERWASHLRGKTPVYESIHRMKKKSGEWIWVQDIGKVVEWTKDGKPKRGTGIHLDYTKQYESAKALMESEMRYRLLFENARDAIFLETEEEGIIAANLAAREIYGYSYEELRGMKTTDLEPPESRRVPPHELYKSADSKELSLFETITIHKDGKRIPIEITLTSFEMNEQTIYLSIVRDISDRSAYEEEKQLYRRELELYSSIIRHDLINDIQVIIGYLDVLKTGLINEVTKEELLDAGLSAAARMNSLLNAFNIPVEHTETRILKILENSANRAMASSPGLDVKVIANSDIERLEVTPSRLLPNIWDNLLRNSATHAGENCEVRIEIKKINGRIEVTFSDNGPGIPDEIQSMLFARGVSTRSNGSGHGLYLSKQIIEALNGTIEYIDSDKESGAVFRISLPVSK